MFALWGFAVAIAYVPTIYSAPFMPRWWALAIGIGCISRLDLRDVAEPLVWCLGLVVLWSGLTLLWSPALFGGALLVGFLVLFVLILMASASAGQDDRNDAFSGFALGILLSAGIALAQKYGHIKGIIQSGDNMPVGLFFNQEVFAETAAPIVVWCLLQNNNAQRVHRCSHCDGSHVHERTCRNLRHCGRTGLRRDPQSENTSGLRGVGFYRWISVAFPESIRQQRAYPVVGDGDSVHHLFRPRHRLVVSGTSVRTRGICP